MAPTPKECVRGCGAGVERGRQGEGEGYVQRFWSACVGKGWLPLWSEHVGPDGWETGGLCHFMERVKCLQGLG